MHCSVFGLVNTTSINARGKLSRSSEGLDCSMTSATLVFYRPRLCSQVFEPTQIRTTGTSSSSPIGWLTCMLSSDVTTERVYGVSLVALLYKYKGKPETLPLAQSNRATVCNFLLTSIDGPIIRPL